MQIFALGGALYVDARRSTLAAPWRLEWIESGVLTSTWNTAPGPTLRLWIPSVSGGFAPPLVSSIVLEGAESKGCVARLDELDTARLAGPWDRKAGRAGAGAAVSFALHGLALAAAFLWSQSVAQLAPEPIAVEVVIEAANPSSQEGAKPTEPSPAPPQAESSASSTVETAPPEVAAAPEPPPPQPEPSAMSAADAPPAVAEAVAPPPDARAPEPSKPETRVPPATEATTGAAPPPKPSLVVKQTPAARVKPAAPARLKPSPRTAAEPPAANAESKPSASSLASPAPASAATAYRNSLFAQISAHRRYPDAALERGAHGVATVRFTLDDSGQVVSVALAQSAGDPALDVDAPATVRRAAPFGPPPQGAPRNYLVPIRYMPR